MEKEMKIIPPEGYEVDKENSTFECIKFKPTNPLPKTWEEFCETHSIKENKEVFVSSVSSIFKPYNSTRDSKIDRNVLPSRQYAEAMLALCQLIQLRDCYNDGWMPDWNSEDNDKWCIEVSRGRIDKAVHTISSHILAFKSSTLRDKFLENFKDLIEIAKPLL